MRAISAPIGAYVTGAGPAILHPESAKWVARVVDQSNEIVDRAIAYTIELLHRMPTYRMAATIGLRRLRDSLARRTPGHPALKRLDRFLETLNDQGAS